LKSVRFIILMPQSSWCGCHGSTLSLKNW
jgi:hypothetical protein